MKTADEADEMLFHRILTNNNHALQSSSQPITLAVQLEDGRPQDVATRNSVTETFLYRLRMPNAVQNMHKTL